MLADSTALCAAHSAPAIGPCERCGTFVCEQCGFRRQDRVRCYQCGAPATEKPPGAPFAALLLSAVGLMCPPLSLLGIAVALLWRFGGDKRPAMGAQYARWAVIVGLLSLAGGGAIYWWAGQLAWAVRKDVSSVNARDPKTP